jgi:hypothetical protein
MGHKKDCCCCDGVVSGNEPLIYEAILTQDGTASPPVATELRNNFSGSFVWEYGSLGAYIGNLTGQFPSQYKVLFFLTLGQGGVAYSCVAYWLDSDRIAIDFFDNAGSPVDFSGLAYITIKVYP